MARGLVASVRVKIAAPATKVWDALVNPETIKQYMFGTTAVSDWKKGGCNLVEGCLEGKGIHGQGYNP